MKKRIEKPYEKDSFFKKWLVGLSERTKENYTNEFNEWFVFIGMTPTEQIQKRMHDSTTQNIAERTFFEDQFRAYKEYLENWGDLKPSAVRTLLTPVASFFSRNGLPLNLKRGDWESTLKQEVVQKSKTTKDDVKSMYSHGNLRDRALLLVLAQSGFSEVDVSSFKIENLKGLYTAPETEHFVVEKPREKTGEMQATCFSYEAVHDIRAMLQERGNPSEGFLFVSTTKGKDDKLEVRSINTAIKNLAEKAFGSKKAKEFKTKSLRSFYNSALLRAGIQPQELKDLMMGHQRRGARKKYDYDEITVKEAYRRAFEYLSINGMQTRSDIAKLKEDFTKTKSQFMDMLAEEKQKRESERQEMFDFIHKNYDSVLNTFNELVATPEGKVALRKLQEKRREKAVAIYREAEQESLCKAEEQLEKEGKLPPKKLDKRK
jgi:integrase